MPLYAYKCRACGKNHEALQKIGDDPLLVCPYCEQHTLERQLTAPVFRLKGTGWYETDFKTDNKRHLAGAEKDDKIDPSDGKDKQDSKKNDDANNVKKDTQAKESSSTAASSSNDSSSTNTTTKESSSTQSSSTKQNTSIKKDTSPTSKSS